MVWLTGGALAVSLLMICGLLLLVIVAGMSTFWPRPLALFPLRNGVHYLGEVTRSEEFTLSKDTLGSLDVAVGRGGVNAAGRQRSGRLAPAAGSDR